MAPTNYNFKVEFFDLSNFHQKWIFNYLFEDKNQIYEVVLNKSSILYKKLDE